MVKRYFNKLDEVSLGNPKLRGKCKCGHTILFSYNTPYRTCKWCGRKAYNNSELGKRYQFKEKLRKMLKE